MLVLTRKKGERIRINDDIVIELLEIKGSIVKLGLTAPAEHVIHREEIYNKIHGNPQPFTNQFKEGESG